LPSYWAGAYFPAENRITVVPSIEGENYGQSFLPGKNRVVSNAARNETEAIQRNLVHEIGHLLLESGPRHARHYVNGVYRRFRSKAVSQYAKKNSLEFFAESWTAYQFEPDALRTHSHEVYAMVEYVLKESNLL
jgi:hypothetical protein